MELSNDLKSLFFSSFRILWSIDQFVTAHNNFEIPKH